MTADPRNIKDTRIGTPTRDAAVDPRPTDFLAPVNAGLPGEEGNPHGPNVWNPEIHASQGVRPVRPGPVDSDPTAQDAAEDAHATAWHEADGSTNPDADPAPDPGV